MLPRQVKLKYQEKEAIEEGVISLMTFAPFFSYYFHDQMVLWPTRDVETLATDGVRIFVNPDYFMKLGAMERCFALAHEVYHVIYRHPVRMRSYKRTGELRGMYNGQMVTVPYYADLFNVSADFVINADLVDSGIGSCNPAWLYDPDIKASELAEEVYVRFLKQRPPQPQPPRGTPCDDGQPQPGQGQGSGQPGEMRSDPMGPGTTGSDDGEPQHGNAPTKTYGDAKGRKAGLDETAQAQGGRFDEVLPPHVDPGTGVDDLPDEMEFREAIQRAEAAAKMAGKMPGNLQRIVKEILQPQISWRDELRLKITGKLGARRETWEHPNRRRIVLKPTIYMPGRQGHGAELIALAIDNSGSIGDDEMTVFFSEAASIVADCRPKRVLLIWADTHIRRIDEARSLDELMHLREAPGGGGTNFRPVFDHLAKERIVPDTLVYLTDMDPSDAWPEAPDYPVIWCSTTDKAGPFGETVRVRV